MDLNEARTSAEKVLAGSDSSEAQTQAHHVLGIVDLVAEAEERYKDLERSINGELAQLRAEAGDLEAHKLRTKIAEAEARKLKEELEDLRKRHDSLAADHHTVKEAAQRIQEAAAQVGSVK